ncbi:hypothetical protein PFISCL1PPCAC_1454, partial [Pristionchus fissidentatus]
IETNDRLPVVLVRIDSDRHIQNFRLSDHIENELSVDCLIHRPVVNFNVNPESVDISTRQRVDTSSHLFLCGTCRSGMTGEEVGFNQIHPSIPSILDVLHS